MTGTNGPTGGNGREPGKGLVDIPKLSAQRKEEIRSGILTGIRSWTKEPEEEPKRTGVNAKRRRLWAGGGAGLAAVAIASVVIVQSGGIANWVGTGSNGGATVNGQPNPAASGLSPVDGSSRYAEELPTVNIDPSEAENDIAEPRLAKTYEEFKWSWAAVANPDAVRIFPSEQEAQSFQNSIPLLTETVQKFGKPGLEYEYTAWSNVKDGNLRELVFRLGPVADGAAENPSDHEVVRFVTTILQPELPESERSELLDKLRFRDFEAKGGTREAESEGLLYTLNRNGDRQRLIVQFLRKQDQPDEMGRLQDSLLQILRREDG
ncbi:hypothetical protein [Saccharibacillus endophyticus]|uniref:Uncharacterized protein n=1 Tax=Saccharibacillus endophyticus TaxID=2060666 RepID=A0ABQ2A1F3_9BACL|nr:hypothetical protein [Saccharibacillus endophyticus]GGH82396.1 hypothetical protein GCM10007362_33650 [Saccharibacillus endophyticus]